VKYSPILNWWYDTEEFGHEDETISSVCGRLELAGKITGLRNFINWLFKTFANEPNHCVDNIETKFLQGEK
jgi:hypothetical protein